MKQAICIALAIGIVLIAAPRAKAIDVETYQRILFFLGQYEDVEWSASDFEESDLQEGLVLAYHEAVEGDAENLRASAVLAMGDTGMLFFEPYIVDSITYDPIPACYGLSNMASESAVAAMIDLLDNEDKYVRDAAAYCLGEFGYFGEFPEAEEDAIDALADRLLVEELDWIRETIQAALLKME